MIRLAFVVSILWIVLCWWGIRLAIGNYREAHRELSPRTGGTPQGIIPPRSRWRLFVFGAPPGLFFRIRRVRERDIASQFADAYIRKWVSWELLAVAFGRMVILQRWRERWAR